MTVYTVEIWYPYEGGEAWAVFSSRELAESYTATLRDYDRKCSIIHEWTVDKHVDNHVGV